MDGRSHTHTDGIIVDADEHFTIDTVTREISNGSNKKLTLMQYDNNSERYSFDIDRIIDGHDLMDCNRVQIHYINIGSNKEKHPNSYTVDDVQVNSSDTNKVTFTWLISQNATMLSGILSFLVSFECINGDNILYRWSSAIYKAIQISAGMDNNNATFELYSDELLAWQNSMEKNFLPNLVDRCYINREFATSEEVAAIFELTEPDISIVTKTTEITSSSTDGQYPSAKAVYTYISNAMNEIENELSGV